MSDDDDDMEMGALYEHGHWVWDDNIEGLVYVSDLQEQPVETTMYPSQVATGPLEFRDTVDLIEQVRYRRRYLRKVKPGEEAIVTVQDVKDIAIYTAPINLLSPMLIDILHISTTERFIRALIFYCQYYLQIADIMAERNLELEVKVRTPECKMVENMYRDNLADLRLLVAKEYSIMLMGGVDTKKFHHMGPQKKRRSLSGKDARLFETMLRMCVQIVWLALGRKCFTQIELEVNRILKSDIFNAVEHTLRSDFINKMGKEERAVLQGHCVRHDQKLNTRSPLMNEVFCHRPIDYRMVGLGVIKYSRLSARFKYMWRAVACNEENLVKAGVTVGILGLKRDAFDTMLEPLQTSAVVSSKSGVSGVTISPPTSRAKVKSSTGSVKDRIYPNIVLPPKESVDDSSMYPPTFPDDREVARPCNEEQRLRWQQRLLRLLYPKTGSR